MTLALAVWAGAATAEDKPKLEYRVQGLNKAQRKNVEAWLGAAPQSAEERAAFMVTARERVARSLQALGYYHPDIAFNLDREGEPWRLEIRVRVGDPVKIAGFDVRVSGAAAEDPEFQALLQKLPLGPGAVLHHGKYEAMKKSLLNLGQRRGYFDAQIVESRVAVEVAANSAQLTLHYDSGERYRFGPLRHDEQSLFTDRLQQLQPFAEGDPFELSLLQEFQSQLQRTGYFGSVLVQPQVDEAEDGVVPLRLELTPATRHSFEVGVGVSTDTQERLSLVWRTPRINRYGHSQETRVEYSTVNPSGRITYNIPLSHPLNDVLQLRARLEQNEFGDLESEQREFGVRREQRSERWVTGLSLRQLNEQWNIADRHEEGDYLLPGLSLSRKYREGPLVDPARGLSQFYQLEGSSDQVGSDLDLVRAYAKWVAVGTLPGERQRLVGRLEAGAVFISEGQRDLLAPSLSFFAGGSQSLRGFPYQSVGKEQRVTRDDGTTDTITVGGDRLLLGSIEYQYRFAEHWRGALFVDAGDAFDEGKFDTKVGVGFGLHYLTPVGAVKVELANSVSEDSPAWRLHINIGAEF
jgi:translocation and assembly module TamA